MKEHIIASEDDGIRLDRWFKRHRPDIPHGLLQKMTRKGQIRIDGSKVTPSDRIKTGQVLLVPDIDQRNVATKKKPISIPEEVLEEFTQSILYQDKHIIVINKPAGLATQGGSKVKISVDAILRAYQKDGERLKLVHRLDKDTSGVLVIARSTDVATTLMEAFKAKQIRKIYWAIVVGRLSMSQGKIDLPLTAKTFHAGNEKTVIDEEGGKPATTYYQVIEQAGDSLAWIALWPRTGRTHQLRAHMDHIEHPILGDGKYGGKEAFIEGLSNQMHLHARRIIIPDLFGKVIDITAPLPSHMQKTWEYLAFDDKDMQDPFESL